MSKQKNVKNLIMGVLPDNRPITSLQIVEDHDKYVQPDPRIFAFNKKNQLLLLLLKFQMSKKFYANSSNV